MSNHATLLKPWKPGQSGNPRGRPKGSRNKPKNELQSDVEKLMQQVAALQTEVADLRIRLMAIQQAPHEPESLSDALDAVVARAVKAANSVDPRRIYRDSFATD